MVGPILSLGSVRGKSMIGLICCPRLLSNANSVLFLHHTPELHVGVGCCHFSHSILHRHGLHDEAGTRRLHPTMDEFHGPHRGWVKGPDAAVGRGQMPLLSLSASAVLLRTVDVADASVPHLLPQLHCSPGALIYGYHDGGAQLALTLARRGYHVSAAHAAAGQDGA